MSAHLDRSNRSLWHLREFGFARVYQSEGFDERHDFGDVDLILAGGSAILGGIDCGVRAQPVTHELRGVQARQPYGFLAFFFRRGELERGRHSGAYHVAGLGENPVH